MYAIEILDWIANSYGHERNLVKIKIIKSVGFIMPGHTHTYIANCT